MARDVPPAENAGEAPRKNGSRAGGTHPAFPDATARTFRILPIAADLMPLEIADSRHVRRLRQFVITGVVVVAVLVGGWYAVTVQDHRDATDALQAVSDTQQGLVRERHNKYDELTKTQAQSKAIEDRLRKALEKDLSWSRLVDSLRSTAAAKNVTLDTVTCALSQNVDPKSVTNLVGTITVTGSAASKAVVAAYVDALGKLTGIANPFPTDTTEDKEKGVTFTIRMEITKAALGGRFSATPAPTPSASGGK